jgi:hypothetical protein
VVDARIETGTLERGFVIVDSGFAEKLRTEHTHTFETELVMAPGGWEEFTSDVPDASDTDKQVLDERGLVRVGTEVVAGTFLIGKSSPTGVEEKKLSVEDKLTNALFGRRRADARDSSRRTPPGYSGTVRAAEITGGRARVTIGWTRELEVGDLLAIDGEHAVVADIRPLGADLAWSGGRTSASVTKIAPARDVMLARAIGPYDRDTQQPLVGREVFGGQPLLREQAEALASVAPWTLWELSTIKSDFVAGRTEAYGAIISGKNPDLDIASPPKAPAPADAFFSFALDPVIAPRDGGVVCAMPDLLARVAAYLRALALDIRFDSPAVRARVLDSDAIRRTSFGKVEDDGSLLSQKIFGPVVDYECECGKYKRMKHRGTVCETCGVEVTRSRVREERFGHIDLPASCAHPWFADVSLDAVPVLPAALRPEASAVHGLYRQLSASPSQDALNALFAALAAEVERLWPVATVNKPVDYSGVAHLVVAPDLAPGRCRVPRSMLEELFAPFVFGILEERFSLGVREARQKKRHGSWECEEALAETSDGYPLLLASGPNLLVRRAEAWDAAAIAVDPATARGLGGATVTVHVPLTHQAALECSKLADLPQPSQPTSEGWLARAVRDGDLLGQLRRACLDGGEDALDDALLAPLLGRPPKMPPEDALLDWREADKARRSALRHAFQEAADPKRRALEQKLDEFTLSITTSVGLAERKFSTLGQLCQWTADDFRRIKGFGPRNIREIEELLGSFGLSIAPEWQPAEAASEVLDESIAVLGLPASTESALTGAGLTTLRALCRKTAVDLLVTARVGVSGLRAVKKSLKERNLALV